MICLTCAVQVVCVQQIFAHPIPGEFAIFSNFQFVCDALRHKVTRIYRKFPVDIREIRLLFEFEV